MLISALASSEKCVTACWFDATVKAPVHDAHCWENLKHMPVICLCSVGAKVNCQECIFHMEIIDY